MPLSLAVAGLTAQEKSMLVQALRSKADELSNAWTLFWEPAEFPESPEAVLYCPHRDEGRKWGDKLRANGSLPIASLPPLEASPSEVPLFVRMPFAPSDLIATLNVAAKRIKAGNPNEGDGAAAPAGEEERVELQFAFRGANRVSSLCLHLYAVFHNAEKPRFYKLRRRDGTHEIWCWPDLGLYWSSLDEDTLASDSEHEYELWNCPGKREALGAKAGELRAHMGLLWRVGARAFKTAETLPWFPVDGKLSLRFWPDAPKDARSMQLIRLLTRLTRAEASIGDLILEMKLSRKELCVMLNGLIMMGCLEKAKEPTREKGPGWELEPEEALFLRALSLKALDELENALERDHAR